MKLHVGCGGTRKEGYVNIEAKNAVAADVKCNALDLDKIYKPETIDEIYTSHMFEHLDRREAVKFLNICTKLLKKGGVLFMAIPCIDYIVDDWKAGIYDDHRFIAVLYGLHRDPYDYHKMGYTKETIVEKIKEYGFVIEKTERGRPGYGPNSPGIMIWAKKQ